MRFNFKLAILFISKVLKQQFPFVSMDKQTVWLLDTWQLSKTITFLLQGNQLSKEKGTPQRKSSLSVTYVLNANLRFLTHFHPFFSNFYCTVTADAFDELFAGPESKAQMKAIFLQAICQRKTQAKNHALAKASASLGSRWA